MVICRRVSIATLQEVLDRFGADSSKRRIVAQRLEHVHQVAHSTGRMARFVVFGSFITAKPEPNDWTSSS